MHDGEVEQPLRVDGVARGELPVLVHHNGDVPLGEKLRAAAQEGFWRGNASAPPRAGGLSVYAGYSRTHRILQSCAPNPCPSGSPSYLL